MFPGDPEAESLVESHVEGQEVLNGERQNLVPQKRRKKLSVGSITRSQEVQISQNIRAASVDGLDKSKQGLASPLLTGNEASNVKSSGSRKQASVRKGKQGQESIAIPANESAAYVSRNTSHARKAGQAPLTEAEVNVGLNA